MMVRVLTQISTREPLPIEIKLILQRIHGQYHIAREEYDEFLCLFLEAITSIRAGDSPCNILQVFKQDIDMLFDFKDDDFKLDVKKRLQVVAMMLDAHIADGSSNGSFHTYADTLEKINKLIESL